MPRHARGHAPQRDEHERGDAAAEDEAEDQRDHRLQGLHGSQRRVVGHRRFTIRINAGNRVGNVHRCGTDR
jgi:hypothetical protein